MRLQRLLIVGCGDIGRRVAALLGRRFRLYALAREKHLFFSSLGILPVPGDLDRRESLSRLAGLAHAVIHLAPPPASGLLDTRTAKLLSALAKGRSLPQRLIYISTSGVYGDCAGARVDETRTPRPQTGRAARRLDAERRVREWGCRNGVAVTILRVPGIYAGDRLPLERLRRGTPALVPDDDVFTNHIHADDLARIITRALVRGRPGRIYNASDDSELRMGEYFDMVAEAFALPRPPRLSRREAVTRLTESQLSFMSESRRLANNRMKRELGVRLAFPTVAEGLAAARAR